MRIGIAEAGRKSQRHHGREERAEHRRAGEPPADRVRGARWMRAARARRRRCPRPRPARSTAHRRPQQRSARAARWRRTARALPPRKRARTRWSDRAQHRRCTIQRNAMHRGERRDRRRHLLPDRERQRGEPAGERGIPGRWPCGQRQRPHQQHKLHVVMIDSAGTEMLQHRRHQRGEDQCEPRRGVAGKFTREPRHAGEEYQQQRHRPHRGGNALGQRRRHDPFACPDQRGERQVDQPRPVHRHAFGRCQPVLREVEPALPGEEVAHLDQPHGVVGGKDLGAAQAA